jgi:WhiB family redox-sensing transcriptional regulator
MLGPEYAWHAQARCSQRKESAKATQEHADRFFPNGRPSSALKKLMCGTCPVREECLAWAIANDAHGIWGGMTEKERAAMQGKDEVHR